MKRTLILAMAVWAGCSNAPQTLEYEQWGSTREALREGRTEGRVALDAIAIDEYTYAVGAMAGLEGEVTIDGGKVLVSKRAGETLETSHDLHGREATMLFLGRVGNWHETRLEEPVAAEDLDAFLGALVAKAGHDATTARVPFVVSGGLTGLHFHVIDGECPIRARMLSKPMERPPFEHRSDRIEGRLVGVYGYQAAGALTHAGSDTHIHAVIPMKGQPATGHVESVGLAAGAMVRIAAKR